MSVYKSVFAILSSLILQSSLAHADVTSRLISGEEMIATMADIEEGGEFKTTVCIDNEDPCSISDNLVYFQLVNPAGEHGGKRIMWVESKALFTSGSLEDWPLAKHGRGSIPRGTLKNAYYLAPEAGGHYVDVMFWQVLMSAEGMAAEVAANPKLAPVVKDGVVTGAPLASHKMGVTIPLEILPGRFAGDTSKIAPDGQCNLNYEMHLHCMDVTLPGNGLKSWAYKQGGGYTSNCSPKRLDLSALINTFHLGLCKGDLVLHFSAKGASIAIGDVSYMLIPN